MMSYDGGQLLSDDLVYPAVWGFSSIEADDVIWWGQLLSDDLVYPAVWSFSNVVTDDVIWWAAVVIWWFSLPCCVGL